MIIYLSLLLLCVGTYADVACCEKKERSTSYLDIAVDLISKAKRTIPTCVENVTKPCPEAKATDCADWFNRGYNKSDVYTIWPVSRVTFNRSVRVFCDMDTEGGGWTVIQRRGNFSKPDDYFYKDWESYKKGFGNVTEEFWLGNDNIFGLTTQKPSSIRFDLQHRNSTKAYAKYSTFWIDDEFHKYMLHIDNYSGNAGNMMKFHNNRNFTTEDQFNDEGAKFSCSTKYKAAWWYKFCGPANLNGLYNAKIEGIWWDSFNPATESSLIRTEMKVRPTNFIPVQKF